MAVGYARLRGSMGATLCHLAARRSAIEFLFWDHWETAVLVQIPAVRSREVTGANVCHLAGLRHVAVRVVALEACLEACGRVGNVWGV